MDKKKALEEKKSERAAAAEKRRQEILDAREAKKKEAEARRQKIIEDRAKARQEKIDARKKLTEEAEGAVKNTDSLQVEETNVKEETPKTKRFIPTSPRRSIFFIAFLSKGSEAHISALTIPYTAGAQIGIVNAAITKNGIANII